MLVGLELAGLELAGQALAGQALAGLELAGQVLVGQVLAELVLAGRVLAGLVASQGTVLQDPGFEGDIGEDNLGTVPVQDTAPAQGTVPGTDPAQDTGPALGTVPDTAPKDFEAHVLPTGSFPHRRSAFLWETYRGQSGFLQPLGR